MKNIEARLKTLEAENRKPLPSYAVTFTNSHRRRMDALDLLLYLDRQRAGVPDLDGIERIEPRTGTLPNGTAWKDLQKDIDERTIEYGKQ